MDRLESSSTTKTKIWVDTGTIPVDSGIKRAKKAYLSALADLNKVREWKALQESRERCKAAIERFGSAAREALSSSQDDSETSLSLAARLNRVPCETAQANKDQLLELGQQDVTHPSMREFSLEIIDTELTEFPRLAENLEPHRGPLTEDANEKVRLAAEVLFATLGDYSISFVTWNEKKQADMVVELAYEKYRDKLADLLTLGAQGKRLTMPKISATLSPSPIKASDSHSLKWVLLATALLLATTLAWRYRHSLGFQAKALPSPAIKS